MKRSSPHLLLQLLSGAFWICFEKLGINQVFWSKVIHLCFFLPWLSKARVDVWTEVKLSRVSSSIWNSTSVVTTILSSITSHQAKTWESRKGVRRHSKDLVWASALSLSSYTGLGKALPPSVSCLLFMKLQNKSWLCHHQRLQGGSRGTTHVGLFHELQSVI